jgi:NAD(P)-dependent dehydrogenase (short-subunit alcohol dehydrogenase family)
LPNALAGAVTVVTGGTGALGRAVAAQLLAQGASLHIPNLDRSELAGFPFAADPRVTITTGVDLTDENAVGKYFAGLPGLWASVHLAGGFAAAPILQTSESDFTAMLRMNALTTFLCCREAVRAIRARAPSAAPGIAGGRIVNVAARPALEPRLGAGMVAYAASKAAVSALTQALAQEVAAEGIWVNAVAPSIIDTPANRRAMPKATHADWPKPEEIAAAIGALVGPDNGVVRGAIVPVYGRA